MFDILYIDDSVMMQFSFYFLLFFNLVMLMYYVLSKDSKELRFLLLGNVASILLYGSVLIAINTPYRLTAFVAFFDVAAITLYFISVYKIFNFKVVYSKYLLLIVINVITAVVLQITSTQVSLIRAFTSLIIIIICIDLLILSLKNKDTDHIPSKWFAIISLILYILFKSTQVIYRIYSISYEVSIDSINTSIVIFTFFSVVFIVLLNVVVLMLRYDFLNRDYIKLSYYDHLTNVPNRRYFDERLEYNLTLLNRKKVSFGLLLIDIDEFKSINDLYTHIIGDDLLIEFADVISNNLRKTDVFSRYGGDEFLLLFHANNEEEFTGMINRIQDIIQASKFTEHKLRVSISGGAVYLSRFVEYTREDIFKLLEEGLYESKEQEGNKVTLK